MIYQQGDVLIKKINRIEGNVKKIIKADYGHVLAFGETTGHCHVVRDDIELFEKDGVLYIFAQCGFTVTHDEHKPITVEKGLYEIGIVQEYDHFAEEARRVQD